MKLISIRVDRMAGPVTVARLVHFRKTLRSSFYLTTAAHFLLFHQFYSTPLHQPFRPSRSFHVHRRRTTTLDGGPGGVTDRQDPSLLGWFILYFTLLFIQNICIKLSANAHKRKPPMEYFRH